MVQEMIDRACQIPEHRGQVCNAFQHIWGYFKKKATDAERKDYMFYWSVITLAMPPKKT